MNPPKALTERRGNILVVTLNRPEVRNAVDLETFELVGAAVEEAEEDPSVYAMVLTGAGDRAFCAGADLKALVRGERMLPEGKEHWSFSGFANHFTSKPTIAAVNGDALGGGAELALACDLVVAVETASFGLPEVKRGLLAAAGGVFRMTRQLPPRVAMELVFTGDPLRAAEALRWGLINRVVAPGRALDAALELAGRVAANAPLAVQASKRIAYDVLQSPHGFERGGEQRLWDRTNAEIAQLMTTEDASEGPRAFAEKRPPVWQAR